MRDEERGRPEPPLERMQFRARPVAQGRIEICQRLVEQEELRIADERAAERDPLPLAAGKRRGLSVEKGRDLKQFGDLADPLRDPAPRRAWTRREPPQR